MMVKIGREAWIDPSWVVAMEFDTQSYANSMGATTLVLHLQDGSERRIRHESGPYAGVDAYEAQRQILAAHAAKPA